ncbi:hypothetical protein [Parabacteroides gordonii]|nr:hypothetical protein [Parabacteroides gordonii]
MGAYLFWVAAYPFPESCLPFSEKLPGNPEKAADSFIASYFSFDV